MTTGGTAGVSASTSAGQNSSHPLEWQFLQCFGERTPGEDIQEGIVANAPPVWYYLLHHNYSC
jgi:hypothetical protein